jgi:hypothetical protein
MLVSGVSGAAAAGAPKELRGTATGSWMAVAGDPEIAVDRTVTGHGRFTIGSADVRGKVRAPGPAGAVEPCRVRLRLVTGSGVLRLVGHSKSDAGAYDYCLDPFRFNFHTKSGSGTFAKTKYSGIGTLSLDFDQPEVTDQGSFTLRLRPT